MLDGLLSFVGDVLVEVIFYQLGRWALRLLSLGRYDPKKSGGNDQLVALLGFLITLAWVGLLVIWANS
ncbi:MAG: hypothetical protein ACRERX_03045 [Pseudomonas sp.]